MEVGSSLILSSAEITALGSTVDKVLESLTLPNPEYQNKIRFGRNKKFYSSIPKTLCYVSREGSNYVLPRYYFGELGKYGNEGRDISGNFKFSLRDYQQIFWDENRCHLDESTGILLEGKCGSGKCHGKGTKILMYDGSVKNVEDIVVGDELMGDDSTPRKVLSLARGREEMFKVIQNKGITYTVNKSHILSLQYRPWGARQGFKSKKDAKDYGKVVDLPLTTYLSLNKTNSKYYYGYVVPVEYSDKEVPFDPYLLGAWLGDGTSKEVSFTCNYNDRALVHYYRDIAEQFNLNVTIHRQFSKGIRNKSNIFRLVRKVNGGTNDLLVLFQSLNLINNKHIPTIYLINSRSKRLQLLAGLLDTDGCLTKGGFEITQKRKTLILQIRTLCWSLGFRAHLSEKFINGVTYYRLLISGNLDQIPTKLSRKKASPRVINKDPYVTSINVESIGEGDYYGFMLDGNHRYCLEDGTVTHNTIMGLWISLERGKQTLVLVPTYYLAKQWQQRISEATTCSSIVIGSSDTEIPVDKDFTIVVMDLFSCRVLPEELVRNVGHVIMDEAHRIGAETYLPILKEIPAKYRTALTATFRRADGVHRILKYHFGLHLVMANEFPRPHVYAIRTGVTIDKIFSSKIPHERFFRFMDENGLKYHESTGAVEFKATDRLKKLIEMWPTKNVEKQELRRVMKKATDLSYPVIDGYLNDHSGRRKLMINLIRKCLDAGRTILFLSKRKDTLKALTEFFSTYKPMLIISETKERTPEEEAYLQNECRLIFGVTQLAKEGLDIDRIDTLIIHLPMKDTEQAIGRTTRIHPSKKYPLVFYPLDNCPLTYATFSNAQKFFKINADYKGIRSIQTIDTVL